MRYSTKQRIRETAGMTDSDTGMFQCESEALIAMVDGFADDLKTRLLEQQGRGFQGWDNPDFMTCDEFQALALQHVRSGHVIDAAAFLAFIWNRQG